MHEWGGEGGRGHRPRGGATHALAPTCTDTETAVETSRDLLSEQNSQTSKGTGRRLWGRREEGGQSLTPSPALLPAWQDAHSVASCLCCSSSDSSRLALCTAACKGAQGTESSWCPAQARPGQGQEPSLTSYCLLRLLMLSSFLSTAAFTLTWEQTRGG